LHHLYVVVLSEFYIISMNFISDTSVLC